MRFSLIAAALLFAPAAWAQNAPASAAPEPMDLSELQDTVTGTQVTIVTTTNQTMTANNSGVIVADNVESGDINLEADAFSGFDGISNFVVNTGHNNNLQSNMSVTVIISP